MVSQHSLLSGVPRLFTIFVISSILLLNLSIAAAQSDSTETNNGITLTDEDQAPECIYQCKALNPNGPGELPKCVINQLTDPKYADVLAADSWTDLDVASVEAIGGLMGCACTDTDFIKGLAGCVFGDECGSNNTAIYDAISIGYKLCGFLYNVTFPAPTEVVKLLDITVPSGAIVPTTITGVPQATAWPGKSISANSASSSASATASATAPSATSNLTNVTTASSNAAMKSAPSYYLAILAFFAFIALFTPSVSAQRNGTVISSSVVPGTTGLPSLNGTTTSTSTLSSTGTTAISTTSARGNTTTTSTTSSKSSSSTLESSTTSTRNVTATRTPSASSPTSTAPSDDDTGNAIRNGASFGLVAAGAFAAAFLF